MTGAIDVLSAVLLLAGAALCLISAVGLLRLPDTVSRLHASSKAQTLGLLLVLTGAALRMPLRYGVTALLIMAFQVLTVPVTGHIVGRIAHRTGAVGRPGLLVDELGERIAREAEEERRAEQRAGRGKSRRGGTPGKGGG